MDFSSFSLRRTQSLKPPRRKLQKCPKFKDLNWKRASMEATRNSIDVPPMRLSAHQMYATGRPSIPMPPDLSDAKWLHYLENNDLMDAASEDERGPTPPPKSPRVIPDMSHVVATQDEVLRPSLEIGSPISPMSTVSTVSSMRRQPKTPVFRIGQLEEPSYGREPEEALKTSSVELIAEQYRALLDARSFEDMESMYSGLEPILEPATIIEEGDDDVIQATADVLPARAYSAPVISPAAHSDAATLVGFEEDAIYFKPVSFSEPCPTTRPQTLQPKTFKPKASSKPSSQDNLSLQICADLLTRELSSAVADRPQRTNDVAALQIWIMIEAYERLRDQVTQMGPPKGELNDVRGVFDSWLGSLYALHTSLTGEARDDESSYEELQEDVD